MSKSDLIIIKLGGSAITDKDKKFTLRKDVLQQISEELSSIKEKLVLVHGGGSYGHPVASKYGISNGFNENSQLLGFSKTRKAMEELNFEIVSSMIEVGIPATSVQTSAFTVVKNGEIFSMDTSILKNLLDLGIVPVLYGDSVIDLEKGMNILSGDQIVSFIARKLEATEVILGVDTDGVYTGDPKSDDNTELISKIPSENWERISSLIEFHSRKEDVTGGMKNKIEELVNLARDGIESRVINITKPGNITKSIKSNKKVGTKISKE